MAVSESPSHTSLALRTGRRAALKPPSFPSIPEGFSPPVHESGWRGRVQDPLWFSARFLLQSCRNTKGKSQHPLLHMESFVPHQRGEKPEFVLAFISHSGMLLQRSTNVSHVSSYQEGVKMFPCPQAMPSCLLSAYFDVNIPVT